MVAGMIALVDYGMGNLRSVEKALARVGGDVRIVSSPKEVAAADALVLPGVGAFGDCLRNLEAAGLVKAVKEFIGSDKPFLGICLGLQALFESGEESPGVAGLGVLSGSVPRFQVNGLKVPHMGWNQLQVKRPGCPLLEGVADGSYVYFVHSFFCKPSDASVVVGTTPYGIEFCSMIWRGNMFATQFHPEKSQEVGLRMLENFVKLANA
jgi:glutamine amidotransferase